MKKEKWQHFKRWNKWRKRSCNSWFVKFMVLIGLIESPTFALVLTDREEREIKEEVDRIFAATEANIRDYHNKT